MKEKDNKKETVEFDNYGDISDLIDKLTNLHTKGYTLYDIKIIDYGDCERWIMNVREKYGD